MRATMSKQLTLSATAAILSMASFALAVGPGGLSLESGHVSASISPQVSVSTTR